MPPNSVHDECVQEAWCENRETLENWVYHHLLNRSDVYGRYRSLASRAGRSKSFTAPADQERRFPGALTSGLIKQHFCGFDPGHLIGIHAISSQDTCRWLAIDIDQHSEDGAIATVANLNAAGHWCGLLTNLGFHPLIMDSNGNGGLHVWLIFRDPVPARVVFHFAQWIVRDHLEFGLRDVPETFPKQASLSESCRFGNWLRLPGRHHTRDHWTAVWDQSHWRVGEAAIHYLLQATGDDVNILREWLNSHPLPMETQSQSNSTIETVTQRPCLPQSPHHIGNATVPRATLSRLSPKTRKFLLGHFKHEPQWNNRLFAAACDMAGNGFRFDDALAQLLRGAGPYDVHECELATRTIESAFSQARRAAFSYAPSPPTKHSIQVGNIEVVLGPQLSPRNPNGREG